VTAARSPIADPLHSHRIRDQWVLWELGRPVAICANQSMALSLRDAEFLKQANELRAGLPDDENHRRV
jgi:hypothetical protein